MTYEEAKKRLKELEHLLGRRTEKGAVISDMLIVPVNAEDRDKFFASYLFNNNSFSSLVPYMYKDLTICAYDRDYLKKYGVMFTIELAQLESME